MVWVRALCNNSSSSVLSRRLPPFIFDANVRATLLMLLHSKVLFGTIQETKLAIAEGGTLEVHYTGNTTATIRKKLEAWNEVRLD